MLFYIKSYEDKEMKKIFMLAVLIASLSFASAVTNAEEEGWKAYENKDYAKAFLLWNKIGEETKNSDIHKQLGAMYNQGMGVEKDFKKAYYWLKKSADADNYLAEYFLGSMYKNGEGVEKNLTTAFKYYLKSARTGNFDWSQHETARAYETGEGVQKDEKEAVYWYKQAIKNGNIMSELLIAYMYEEGRGTLKDYKKANEIFHRLAKGSGFLASQAQYHLGASYANGFAGLLTNYDKSIEYYKMAIKNDEPRAKCSLAGVLLTAYPTLENKKKMKNLVQEGYDETNDAFCQKAWNHYELFKY